MPIALPVHGHERWRPTTPQESVRALPEHALSPAGIASTASNSVDTALGVTRRLGLKLHHILPLLNTCKA